jgi:hypothetical protein
VRRRGLAVLLGPRAVNALARHNVPKVGEIEQRQLARDLELVALGQVEFGQL